jgi:hypothetical protein
MTNTHKRCHHTPSIDASVPSNTFKKESETLLPGPLGPRVSPGTQREEGIA